jgi:hypothetical protein
MQYVVKIQFMYRLAASLDDDQQLISVWVLTRQDRYPHMCLQL